MYFYPDDLFHTWKHLDFSLKQSFKREVGNFSHSCQATRPYIMLEIARMSFRHQFRLVIFVIGKQH